MITRAALPGYEWIGFENHLNVFHAGKSGLEESLARGFCIYLNSTQADLFFRDFNGHTQVNATDLKAMLYPSTRQLEQLGVWADRMPPPTQKQIDSMVEQVSGNG